MGKSPPMSGEDCRRRKLSTTPGAYPTLVWRYHRELEVLAYSIRPDPLPCFTERVLRDLADFQADVASGALLGKETRVEFVVAASAAPNGECLGGDLAFFLNAVREKDRSALVTYARRGVSVLFKNYTGLDSGVTTLALLKGATLGAGFEAALSCDLIVAERGIKIGFPEVLFNMFPGIGAMCFLTRRISPHSAEQMILGGKLYRSEDLKEIGLVDHLLESGSGETRVLRLIQSLKKSRGTRAALVRTRARLNAVTLSELEDIAGYWVDAALQLSDLDLRNVERLLAAQIRKANLSASVTVSH